MNDMDCRRAGELMNLCLDAELPEHDAAAFYEHLASCDRCAREYAELSKIMHELSRQPVPAPPSGYWDDVWREVRRRAVGSAKQKAPVFRLRPALAAVLALVCLMIGVSHRLHTPPSSAEFPSSETTSQHALVMMHHPYTEPGLILFAMAEGTLASYNERNNATN